MSTNTNLVYHIFKGLYLTLLLQPLCLLFSYLKNTNLFLNHCVPNCKRISTHNKLLIYAAALFLCCKYTIQTHTQTLHTHKHTHTKYGNLNALQFGFFNQLIAPLVAAQSSQGIPNVGVMMVEQRRA